MPDLSTTVPLWAGMGVALVGFAAGLTWATCAAHDRRNTARRHMQLGVHYWSRAEQLASRAAAAYTPTQQIPTVQLLADPPTIALRVRTAIHAAADSLRELRPEPQLPDWTTEELAAAFAGNDEDTVAWPTPQPAPPPQPTPAMKTAPQRRDTVILPLPARQREWRIFPRLTPPPVPQLMARQRHYHPTPALLADLPPDPTRQYRVQTVPACS